MMAGDIESKDVRLKIDFAMRTIQGQHQRWKKFFPAM
jgi:hypothetical protein